jgi:hypothetical protein
MKIVPLLLIVGLLLSAGLFTTAGAQDSPNWKRVYTGDDYSIDVNVASLVFGINQILRAEIRTVFDREELRDGAKSKTRMERIEYNLHENNYRIVQFVLLDGAGKPVQTYNVEAVVWKRLTPDGMMGRVLLAARAGLPFGKWKVSSYRVAEMNEQSKQSSEDFEQLIGATVVLEGPFAQVQQSICGNPSYRSERFTVSELSEKLGGNIKLPEVQSDRVDLIYLKCETDGWAPPQSMLVKLREGRMLMLWKGVFLNLKRA